ncbi:carboxymuconolactone decarboxylase family protein [Actinoplanes sp. NPDC026619]|uniref:carboxymuconolactone decarboxylase family protein n=1 Tax=Actinoplanes sp. NPDC026619 TaxID=3155798 RepID=UPI0034091105
MTRVSGTQGEGEVAERIRARRGGALRPLDEVLLHSPPLADGWNSLLGAVRGDFALDPALRELIILRIAVLNRADYEWTAHEPVARAAGVTDEQLEGVRTGERTPFTAAQRAALDHTDAMTRGIEVPESVFAALRPHFDERGLVELTAVAAAYNMVSRFLVALEVAK